MMIIMLYYYLIFKLVIFIDENAVEPFIYPNILAVVLFKSSINNIEFVDKLFILYSLIFNL